MTGVHSGETALREQLSMAKEESRRLIGENEQLKERLESLSDHLQQKESAQAAQVRRLEAAETKIRELVRSEGEADYRSRTLAAKMSAAEKTLEEAQNQRRSLEKKLQVSLQQVQELTLQSQSQGSRLEELRNSSQRRHQDAETLEQQNRDLESKLARAVSKLELYQGKLGTLQRQISDRETEMVLGHQKVEIALKERDVARKELDDTRKQAKSYRDNLNDLEQTVATNRRQLAETEEALERTKALALRSDKSSQELHEELAQVQAELAQTRSQLLEESEKSAVFGERAELLEAELLEESQRWHTELLERQRELTELNQSVESTQSSLVEQQSIAEDLRAEKASLGRELEERTEQLRELKALFERVKPAYETLKSRYSDLQTEHKDRVAELDSLNSQLSGVRSTSDDLESQHRSLQREIQSLQNERNDLTQRLSELEDVLATERTGLEEAVRENEELADSLRAEQDEKARLKVEVASLEQNQETLEHEKSELHERYEALEAELSVLGDRLIEVEAEHRSTAERAEEAEKELETRKRQIGKLVDDLKQQTAVATKAQANIEVLLKQRMQLLEVRKHLEGQLEAGGLAAEETDQRIVLLEQERASLETALTELQQEFDDSVAVHEDRQAELESELGLTQNQVSALTAQHAEAVEEHRQLENQLSERIRGLEKDLEREIQERDHQLFELAAELERALEEQADDHQRFEEREQELERILDELRSERESLAVSLDESQSLGSQQDHRIEELQTQLETLRGHQSALSQELHAEREQGVRLVAELAQEKDEVQDLQEQTLQLQAEIETLESELRARQEESSFQIAQRVELEESLRVNSQRQDETFTALERAQRECQSLREFVERLQKASRERLEQAKGALQTREGQLRKLQEAVTTRAKQAAIAEAKLERTQLAEKALRGALGDMRHLLNAKDEMVQELEWHLGLVYQTLEEGQAELQEHKSAIEGLRQTQAGLQSELSRSQTEQELLANTVAEMVDENSQLGHDIDTLQTAQRETSSELANERRQLAHTLDKLERALTRLDRVQADLVEEQERSARLGAQLTDALEDRNRSVVRLRDLQHEFQSWRDNQVANAGSSGEMSQDSEALALSLARETALRGELERLKEQATEPQGAGREEELKRELTALRASRDEAYQALEAAREGGLPSPDLELLKEQLVNGFDLGAELVSSQLEYMAAEEARNSLLMEIQRTEDLDAMSHLEDELSETEQLLTDRQVEFESLDEAWNSFQADLDETAQTLLQKFTGLIEYEMREAREAAERTHALSQELETTKSDYRRQLASLEKKIEEKDGVTSELEDELAQQASLVTELAEQLAAFEADSALGGVVSEDIAALRRELAAKNELLGHLQDNNVEGLREQVESFALQQVQYRQRIAELLGMVAERQEKLDQLERNEKTVLEVTPPTVLPNESLDDKLERLQDLEEQQAEDKSNLAAKRAEVVSLGNLGTAEARDRLQGEIVTLINALADREDQIRALEDEIDAAVNQPTSEDMPIVNASRLEFSDSSEFRLD